MPTRRVHLKFDEYLREHAIITGYTYAYKVHDRMDRDAKKHGHWFHRETDFYHCEEGIREWLQKWQHLAYQETLTDYLRIALGHLVLDEVAYRFPHKNEDELIKSAYRSFIQRGLHRKYFKEKL
ncbi:MAG: hypothetical protein ACLFU9_00375 [Candidatus Bathyarchaeia archaeon]